MFRVAIGFVGSVLLAALIRAAPQQSSDPGQLSAGVRGSPMPGLPNIGVELGLNTAGRIESLLVYHGQQLAQTLNVCTEEPVAREKQVGSLATADYNFDGYSDLALQVTAEKQNNNTFCVWLFDPQEQRFRASSQLSQLINPVPDPKTRTVVSTKYGPCPYCYDKQVFKWSGGQLELSRHETLTMDPLAIGTGGCNYVHTVEESKDGKMRQVNRERATALGGPCANEL